jgi:hypothetical protein
VSPEAAREPAPGRRWLTSPGLLLTELVIGSVYAVAGLVPLWVSELQSRRTASAEVL